jgi:hypothetical protein
LVGGELAWAELRDQCVPLWVRSPTELRAIAERLAKAQFTRNRDPTECALLYMALDKRSALTAFFRAVKNEKLSAFFARDFSLPENRGAAVKNGAPPRPSPRTFRTRCVPHSVLIGHAASLTPY